MGKWIFGMHFLVVSCCCRKILEHCTGRQISCITLPLTIMKCNSHQGIYSQIDVCLLYLLTNTMTHIITNRYCNNSIDYSTYYKCQSSYDQCSLWFTYWRQIESRISNKSILWTVQVCCLVTFYFLFPFKSSEKDVRKI